jgi:protein involved in polysaccharide export with SLBB domain
MKSQFWQQTKRMAQWLGMLLLTGLVVAGCATSEENRPFSPLPPDLAGSQGIAATNPATATSPATGGLGSVWKDADRFAIGDLVTVKFSGTIDTIQQHEERIKGDGTITLYLIGPVKADGKTPGELQREIHDLFVPKYYKRLTVIVTGEQRVYYVGGQVRQPGRQVYLGATTVTKAIQSAGDFTDFAARKRVELTRADGKTITVDCVKAARDPSLDPPVFPGDKVNVPMRGPGEIFGW